MIHKDSIYYKAGYKYVLAETAVFQTGVRPIDNLNSVSTCYVSLNRTGKLTIHAGFPWDGPSGTTIDTSNSMAAALLHDALYKLFRWKLADVDVYRSVADREFRDHLKANGMCQPRRWVWFRAVRRLARFAALPEARKPVLTAPKNTL